MKIYKFYVLDGNIIQHDIDSLEENKMSKIAQFVDADVAYNEVSALHKVIQGKDARIAELEAQLEAEKRPQNGDMVCRCGIRMHNCKFPNCASCGPCEPI